MFPRRRTTSKHSNARAAAAGVAAGALAIGMATGINLGILGAAGSPRGPGALGAAQVVAVGRPGHDGGHPGGSRRVAERQVEVDHGTEHTEPAETAAAVTTSPRVARPSTPPSWSPIPPPAGRPSPAAAPGWSPRSGGSDVPGEAEAEPHHRFGAKDDD